MTFSSSLTINPALFPPFCTTSSYSSSYVHFSVRFSRLSSSRTKPISLSSTEARFLQSKAASSSGRRRLRRRPFFVAGSDMTITEEEEGPPPLLESEGNSRPRRIVLFVEPSPFAWVSAILMGLICLESPCFAGFSKFSVVGSVTDRLAFYFIWFSYEFIVFGKLTMVVCGEVVLKSEFLVLAVIWWVLKVNFVGFFLRF